MGTDRVVGAKLATFEGAAQVAADVASGHDQAAERSFGVGRAGVDKQTVGTGSGKDAFAERGSGIVPLASLSISGFSVSAFQLFSWSRLQPFHPSPACLPTGPLSVNHGI
jgi:hypothetical protein